MIYVLIHEYSDRSAFKVCGVTEDRNMAKAWFHAGTAMHSRETNVYEVPTVNVFDTDGYKKWDVGPA
jgi:hypothetical protein